MAHSSVVKYKLTLLFVYFLHKDYFIFIFFNDVSQGILYSSESM